MHHEVTISGDIRYFLFFFFNDTATTEIYTLSLHDALPILIASRQMRDFSNLTSKDVLFLGISGLTTTLSWIFYYRRSEEHTSELQSPCNLVCRLLLEKKKQKQPNHMQLTCIRDISHPKNIS